MRTLARIVMGFLNLSFPMACVVLVLIFFLPPMAKSAYDGVFHTETGLLTFEEWHTLAEGRVGSHNRYGLSYGPRIEYAVACVERGGSLDDCDPDTAIDRAVMAASGSGKPVWHSYPSDFREDDLNAACFRSLSALDDNSHDLGDMFGVNAARQTWADRRQAISALLEARPALWADMTGDCKP